MKVTLTNSPLNFLLFQTTKLKNRTSFYSRTSRRQSFRMARQTPQSGLRKRPRKRHARAGHPLHSATPSIPRKLSIRTTFHAGDLTEDRKRICDGRWGHLHGVAHTQRLGKRLHRRSCYHAICSECSQRTRKNTEEDERAEGVQQANGGREL